MVTVTVQWYQSDDSVTASLRLKPLPPHTKDDVTLHLDERYCAIRVAGVYGDYTIVLGLRLKQDASACSSYRELSLTSSYVMRM